MRRALVLALVLWGCGLSASPARADEPGAFDYWILALSWSPQHCESRPGDPQCVYAHDFIVHGLWPQHERGFPDFCARSAKVPETLVSRMLPLMPSESLIQHQWRKHGTCSGLEMEEYFLQTERARRAVAIPPDYRNPATHRSTSLSEIEQAFIAVNPQLRPDGIAVQCSGRWLREVRICFNRQFQPRACGADVEDRCNANVVMRPHRKARSSDRRE